MRSTNEIIIAVKEQQPVTMEELKLALLVMASLDHFQRQTINKLIETHEENPQQMRLRIGFAKQQQESLFAISKNDPRKALGPQGIPGTPENEAFVKICQASHKSATA